MGGTSANDDILQVITDLDDAITAKDLDATMALFANEPDTIWLGSEPGEIAVGYATIEAFFKQVYETQYRIRWTWKKSQAWHSGDVGWFWVDSTAFLTQGGQHITGPYIMTGSLILRGGKWLLRLFHGSEPTPLVPPS